MKTTYMYKVGSRCQVDHRLDNPEANRLVAAPDMVDVTSCHENFRERKYGGGNRNGLEGMCDATILHHVIV